MAARVIRQLLSINGLKIECPNCGEVSPIRRAQPFSMYEEPPPPAHKIMSERAQAVVDLAEEMREKRKLLAEDRKKKPGRITGAAQASLFGQISEQILPAFLTFPYERNECRILSRPIDYAVFSGLSKGPRVDAIRLVEVKTGNGRLQAEQRQIRDRVLEGKVRHKVIGR